jgi:hypothetical protein
MSFKSIKNLFNSPYFWNILLVFSIFFLFSIGLAEMLNNFYIDKEYSYILIPLSGLLFLNYRFIKKSTKNNLDVDIKIKNKCYYFFIFVIFFISTINLAKIIRDFLYGNNYFYNNYNSYFIVFSLLFLYYILYSTLNEKGKNILKKIAFSFFILLNISLILSLFLFNHINI